MNRQWRVRVSGKPRENPDMNLLVQAVLALGEQMQREADERGTVRVGDAAIDVATQEGLARAPEGSQEHSGRAHP